MTPDTSTDNAGARTLHPGARRVGCDHRQPGGLLRCRRQGAPVGNANNTGVQRRRTVVPSSVPCRRLQRRQQRQQPQAGRDLPEHGVELRTRTTRSRPTSRTWCCTARSCSKALAQAAQRVRPHIVTARTSTPRSSGRPRRSCLRAATRTPLTVATPTTGAHSPLPCPASGRTVRSTRSPRVGHPRHRPEPDAVRRHRRTVRALFRLRRRRSAAHRWRSAGQPGQHQHHPWCHRLTRRRSPTNPGPSQGGAIMTDQYVRDFNITNNQIQSNGGTYGTIRIGTPDLPGRAPTT